MVMAVVRSRMVLVGMASVVDMVHLRLYLCSLLLLLCSHLPPLAVGDLHLYLWPGLEGSCASVRPSHIVNVLVEQIGSEGSHLQASAAKDALIQHDRIVDQTRFSELHIRIPACAD